MTEIKLTKRLQRVFDYMVEFGSITSLQAFVDLGETRLSGAIYELKKKGVNVTAEDVTVLNRYNEKTAKKRSFLFGKLL